MIKRRIIVFFDEKLTGVYRLIPLFLSLLCVGIINNSYGMLVTTPTMARNVGDNTNNGEDNTNNGEDNTNIGKELARTTLTLTKSHE